MNRRNMIHLVFLKGPEHIMCRRAIGRSYSIHVLLHTNMSRIWDSDHTRRPAGLLYITFPDG